MPFRNREQHPHENVMPITVRMAINSGRWFIFLRRNHVRLIFMALA
jgi:hypothetical protein